MVRAGRTDVVESVDRVRADEGRFVEMWRAVGALVVLLQHVQWSVCLVPGVTLGEGAGAPAVAVRFGDGGAIDAAAVGAAGGGGDLGACAGGLGRLSVDDLREAGSPEAGGAGSRTVRVVARADGRCNGCVDGRAGCFAWESCRGTDGRGGAGFVGASGRDRGGGDCRVGEARGGLVGLGCGVVMGARTSLCAGFGGVERVEEIFGCLMSGIDRLGI